MKLLIAGSRSITEFDLAPYIPPEVDLIITGGANGVDTLAEQYADAHKISKLVLRPQYGRYGRGAPLKRNEEIAAYADEALAFWDGQSRGTAHTVSLFKSLGKKVTVIILPATDQKGQR